MSHVELQPERVGAKQGPNVGKGSRCPLCYLFYHFCCQNLTTSAFSPYLQICSICTFSSLLQLVLHRLLSSFIASPFGLQYSHAPIFLPDSFSSPRSSFSVFDRRSQAWTFQQTRAIKVALAGFYWEISVVQSTQVLLRGRKGGGFFKECYEFGKSSHSVNDSQAVQFLHSHMVTSVVSLFSALFRHIDLRRSFN